MSNIGPSVNVKNLFKVNIFEAFRGRVRWMKRGVIGFQKNLKSGLLVTRAKLSRLRFRMREVISPSEFAESLVALDHLNVVYINLDKRLDRLAEVRQELRNLGFQKTQRFSAVGSEDGLIGCAKSHLRVIEDFLASGESQILVCEDDILFLSSPEEVKRVINDFLNDPVLDVLCLGNNTLGPLRGWSENLHLVSDTQTTSCYLIKREAAFHLRKNLIKGIAGLIATGNVGKFALDTHWKRLQGGKLKFAVPRQRLLVQRPSISDIQKDWVNYNV